MADGRRARTDRPKAAKAGALPGISRAFLTNSSWLGRVASDPPRSPPPRPHVPLFALVSQDPGGEPAAAGGVNDQGHVRTARRAAWTSTEVSTRTSTALVSGS
jgi:hypothetical protein